MIKGVSANDAARWLSIGGAQFQPSELAKLCLIIMTADWISRAKKQKMMNLSVNILNGLLYLLLLRVDLFYQRISLRQHCFS
ncbi:MAG: FtsW/RodA/SpoVE family cell cycle protein [Prevotellaceae bacterium]|nr:FtsW/RodA/SpoVE family cell cycle protein [Prevotellaceae bacterium]